MSYEDSIEQRDQTVQTDNPGREKGWWPTGKEIAKHSGLFLLTFATVTLTGILWVGQTAHADQYLDMLPEGILFASVFLLFLAAHEFGHYFAALYHRVRVTLPYFIPVPIGIGTLGAVIRIKERVEDTRKLFDIGIAGPIAGFIISILTLFYGFATLPGPEFIENFSHHDEVIEHVQSTGSWPDSPPDVSEGMLMVLGETILYSFVSSFFEDAPPMWEIYHYPFLFAGWLGLFFTALNLMPVGQLDGGHILYSLIGFRKHRVVARIVFGIITLFAGIEVIPLLYEWLSHYIEPTFPLAILIWSLALFFLIKRACLNDQSWAAPIWALSILGSVTWLAVSADGLDQSGSLIWLFWSLFLTYFTGLEHPPALYERNLSPTRKVLGWMSMVIFVLCISPNPIYFLN